MLSKRERKVMGAVYSLTTDKKSLLISPIDLVKISAVKDATVSDIEKTVLALSQDGYFDLVYSDRHGDTVYCITLTEKGKGFERDALLVRRTVVFRVILSVCLAVMSFIIGLILKAIF